MKTIKELEVINYIETSHRSGRPVKIDAILEARMRKFLRLRQVAYWK